MNVRYSLLALSLAVSCTTENSVLSQAADYYNLANELREESELDQAMENYTKALELQPGMYAAMYNLSLVQAETGRYEEALDGLLRLMNEVAPSNLKVKRAIAWVYYESGDYLKAREYYLSILLVSEGDKKALAGLAKTAESMNDFNEAVRLWEQLVDLDSQTENLIGLANALAMKGDYELSISRYAEVLLNERDNFVARKGAAESARKDNNYSMALDYLTEGLETGGETAPHNPELWWHISLIYILDMKDYEKGLDFFRMALAAGYPDEETSLNFIKEREGEELRGALFEIRKSFVDSEE